MRFCHTHFASKLWHRHMSNATLGCAECLLGPYAHKAQMSNFIPYSTTLVTFLVYSSCLLCENTIVRRKHVFQE
jgi:hypothetical protein